MPKAGDETLLRRYLQPVEFGVGHLPYIKVRDSAVDAIWHGANLAATGVVQLSTGIKKDDMITIKTLKDEVIALARATESSERIAKAKSGIIADSERVLMTRGRYPQLWKKRSKEA